MTQQEYLQLKICSQSTVDRDGLSDGNNNDDVLVYLNNIEKKNKKNSYNFNEEITYNI